MKIQMDRNWGKCLLEEPLKVRLCFASLIGKKQAKSFSQRHTLTSDLSGKEKQFPVSPIFLSLSQSMLPVRNFDPSGTGFPGPWVASNDRMKILPHKAEGEGLKIPSRSPLSSQRTKTDEQIEMWEEQRGSESWQRHWKGWKGEKESEEQEAI